MPSYFFHLLFELYPPSVLAQSGLPLEEEEEATTKQRHPDVVAGVKEKVHPQANLHWSTSSTQALPRRFTIPGKGFDIFDPQALVDHGGPAGSEDGDAYLGRQEQGSGSTVDNLRTKEDSSVVKKKGLHDGGNTDIHPGDRQRKRHIDFRFGRVTVESIDLIAEQVGSPKPATSSISPTQISSTSPSPSPSTSAAPPKNHAHQSTTKSKNNNMGTAKQPITNNLLKPPQKQPPAAVVNEAQSSNKPLQATARSRIAGVSAPPKARFIPLTSKTTEFGYGVVHLYRDGEETNGIYPVPESYVPVQGDLSGSMAQTSASGASSTNTSAAGSSGQPGETDAEDNDDSLRRVAVLAVPSYMTASDFMGFVGEETRENVSHFRMIRTGKANRYMVLMMFRTKQGAREFVKAFNGKVFNSMEVITALSPPISIVLVSRVFYEPENCHVVFIKSIEFTSPATEEPSSPSSASFPVNMSNDPFSPRARPTLKQPAILQAQPTAATISTKPAPPPTPSLLELPTCPVCLERMDETTGLLTILCQHVFHCACLSKWKDSSCPVCRYSQAGVMGRARSGDDDESEEFCNVCGADSNLWICLICGHIGCGRYDDAHAFQHYELTGHTYAMDVDTQRVWDYAGDGYVHRLIQNKSDGKLVELPSALSSSTTGNHADGDYVPREKLENIAMEYTYLLTSQLESQRTYFEEKVAQAADKAASATRDATDATTVLGKLTCELETLKNQYTVLSTETIPQLTRDKERAERKAEKFSEMARRLEREWKEEKSMNGSLLEKVEYLSKMEEERKKESEDLKEQLRDLFFFLDARDKLKEAGEEVVEGTVTVADPPPPPSSKKKKGKGKR
ncbi:hypothetical protein DFH27DRAFT_598607 [Peziza echinospora]|nr:hypothetical protein DFH27DRAFT_598607 [Peziza echinospora]